MKKKLALLAAAALLGVGAASPATAGDRIAQTETTAEDDDGDGFPWGLLGLLGLGGLAGLRRRDDRDRDRVVARDTRGGMPDDRV